MPKPSTIPTSNTPALLWPGRSWWSNVNIKNLRCDAIAAATTAIIVLPQGVAYAIVAGLPPEYGLYTAIVPVIVAALFGSSHHIVCGPTTPLALLVFATVSPLAEPGSLHYVTLVITLTLLTGIYQLVLALARMGTLANFISHSVIAGFTAGAAILIIVGQIDTALGIALPQGLSLIDTLLALASKLNETNVASLVVAAATLFAAVLFSRYLPRWPGLLLALLIGSALAALLGGEHRGITLLGSLPSMFPPLSLPDYELVNWPPLLSGALAIALVGLVEAVSIARSVASRSLQPQNLNQEFFGQGLSNIAGSIFSSYPSTASFARSNVNVHAGAKTPLAAVFSGAIVLVILVIVAPLAAYLPMSAVAGILLLISFKLIDFHDIKIIIRTSRQEAAVVVTTFMACVFVALDFGIYVGVILSLVLHLNRISHPKVISCAPNARSANRRFLNVAKDPEHKTCPQLNIVRIDGSLFFGSISHIEDALRHMDAGREQPRSLLLMCYGVNFIDISGAQFIEQEARRRSTVGAALYLCGMKKGVYEFLERSGTLTQLGAEHVFRSKNEAIATIFSQLDYQRCRRCEARIFTECQTIARDEPIRP